eukprot:255248-Chlamydomonas_euryale.AAC.1
MKSRLFSTTTCARGGRGGERGHGGRFRDAEVCGVALIQHDQRRVRGGGACVRGEREYGACMR